MEKFEFNTEFQKYLSLMGYDLKKMPDIQRKEIRRAFVFGMCQMFRVMTHKIAELPEKEAYEYFDQIEAKAAQYIELEIK